MNIYVSRDKGNDGSWVACDDRGYTIKRVEICFETGKPTTVLLNGSSAPEGTKVFRNGTLIAHVVAPIRNDSC